jgi:hypothetical protein
MTSFLTPSHRTIGFKRLLHPCKPLPLPEIKFTFVESMDNAIGRNEVESFRIELQELGRSLRSSFRIPGSQSQRSSSRLSVRDDDDDEFELQWAAIERLPTFERLRTSLFNQNTSEVDDKELNKRGVVDVTRLGPIEKRMFIDSLIKHIENDNLRLLQKQRERIDK